MKFSPRKKYLVVNIFLFAILFLSISFNKAYIRPRYGDMPVVGILTGSFPNFIAVYIISLFALLPVLEKKLKNNRLIYYAIVFVVFAILTIEEMAPFFGASTQYDLYDIMANGLGALMAIVTFEIVKLKTQHN